jgi:hypothetical protein
VFLPHKAAGKGTMAKGTAKKTNMGPSIPLANSNQAMGHGTQTNAQEG